MASHFTFETAVLANIKLYQPKFKTKHDAIFYFFHSILVCNEFRLVSFEEDGPFSKDFQYGIVPEYWNSNIDSYCFRYFFKNKEYILKGLRMENFLIIVGIEKENKEIFRLELQVDNYINHNAQLPGEVIDNDSYEKMIDILYPSPSQLIDLFKSHIYSPMLKLSPKLNENNNNISTSIPNNPIYNPPQYPPHIYNEPNFPHHPPGQIGPDNLVGPHHPIFGDVPGPPMMGRPGRGVPPRARFDPFAPFPNHLNPDHLPPPGPNPGSSGFFPFI